MTDADKPLPGSFEWWFTEQPELDNYVSASVAMFRAYLDEMELKDEFSEPTLVSPEGKQ